MKELLAYSFRPKLNKKWVSRGEMARDTATRLGLPTRDIVEQARRSIYYGVEVELPGPSRQFLLEAVGEVDDSRCDVFYCKYDGSIPPTGVELVSQPATERYHLHHMGWAALWEKLETRLGEVSDADLWGRCGMHVHISRDMALEPMARNIAHWRLYGLCDHLLPQLEVLAGRKTNRYCNPIQRQRDITPDAMPQSYKNVPLFGNYRYQVLNPKNKRTLEFRLCAAPRNHREFRERLELAQALVGYALMPVAVPDDGAWISFPAGVRLTAEDFFGWVAVQKKRFPNFYALCVEEGFIRPLSVRDDGQLWLPFVDELELSEEEIRQVPVVRRTRRRRRSD